MEQATIIGIDLAKNVFQIHGAGADGAVAFRKKVARAKLLSFLSSQAPCLVAMEACGSSHHWGREIQALGHDVRLIAPAYVKPFVKRQKNDMADAEAIAEAASSVDGGENPRIDGAVAAEGGLTRRVHVRPCAARARAKIR